MSAYKGGEINVMLKRPPSTRLSEDQLLKGSYYDIIARSRSIHRNTSIGGAITSCYTDYMAERALYPIGLPQEAEKIWKKFVKRAGIDGIKSLSILYQDIVASEVESGDVLAVAVSDKSLPIEAIRTRVQLISGSRIRTPAQFSNDENVKFGVRFDANGRELGYYVYDSGIKYNQEKFRYLPRNDPKTGRFISILLRRPDKMFPEMTRQLPVCTNIIQEIEDLASLWDSAIQGADVRAMLNVLLEIENPNDAVSALGGKDNDDQLTEFSDNFGIDHVTGTMTKGSVSTLPLGTKPHQINHQGNMDLDVLFIRICRFISSAIGVPYEILMKDFANANFSTAKLGFDSFFRKIKKWTAGNSVFFDQLLRLVMAEARLKGLLTEEIDFDKIKWIGPVMPDIDPNKNSTAEAKRIDYGLVTRSELLAERGSSFEEYVKIRERENEILKNSELQNKEKVKSESND